MAPPLNGESMYSLFYILGYLAILGFICLAVLKMRSFVKASPLHVRWELYPVPHEGPVKYSYGGSYMEESNWWTKPRHVDHWEDIKAMVMEILFLHATYEHNQKLWVRTYPFHLGLYMLMGGVMILLFAVILQLFGVGANNGFMLFLGNLVNAMALFGSFAIAAGGIALILRRLEDKGLNKYTTPEMFFNLGAFVVFALLTMAAWVFNPSYFDISREYLYNLFTLNFRPLGSTWFVLNILAGYVVLIWIPVTNMRHLLIKYFMYHDIRWEDKSTVWSEKNQELIPEMLKKKVTWSASHITGDGEKTWADVAMTNPAAPDKSE